jgi:hypothetical protein
MLWLRLPGRKKSIRAALALEVLDVFVGQLDIALAVSGSQHILARMAIDDDAAAIAAAAKSIFIVASLSLSSDDWQSSGWRCKEIPAPSKCDPDDSTWRRRGNTGNDIPANKMRDDQQ